MNAFDKGATGCGELSKILEAITDDLWKRGYSNEDLQKIYGGNKMRVYQQVWECVPAEEKKKGAEHRAKGIKKLKHEILGDPHDPLNPKVAASL